jgi:hypothetical protein
MRAWGGIIMSFFGAVFAATTLYWQLHILGIALAAPFIVFAAILLIAVCVIRLPGEGIIPSEKAKRAIMWSSTAEGFGTFLAANIVMNLHRPELLLPAIALVVGLHFLPIAYASAFPVFYVLGGALILLSIAGALVPAPLGGEISGFMAALSLWAAAILAVHRDWRAKQGSPA